MSSGFQTPAVHVPSDNAVLQMEAVFTASRFWATLLRAALLDVRVALCAKYAVVHKPNLHSMLAWWPINIQDPGAAEEDEAAPHGPGGVRRTSANRFILPVMVEKRHLPTGERARPEDNHDVEEVSVTNPFPPISLGLCFVVASIVLLYDKEPCVSAVIAKKLASCGVVAGVPQVKDAHGPPRSVLLTDGRVLDGIGNPPPPALTDAPSSGLSPSSSPSSRAASG